MNTHVPLLAVDDLTVEWGSGRDRVHAVRGLTLSVPEKKTVGLVGESGCGKTVSMLAVLGLLPHGARVGGTVRYRGEPVDSPEKVTALRGSRIAMVFQDAMRSLNPLMKVGPQVAEALRHHQGMSRQDAGEAAIRFLERVKLQSPSKIYHAYPHELSGGMRQRVMIASALACEPELLIADEPTTGLDVTVQAQIMDLLMEIQAGSGLAVVFISHDIGAVAELCDDICVVYGGRTVERGHTASVLAEPRHPYTRALLGSMPKIGRRERLEGIDGMPPGPRRYPPGCSFTPRCPHAMPRCSEPPPLVQVAPGRAVECWLEVSGDG